MSGINEALLIGGGVITALRLSGCAWSRRKAIKRVLRRRQEDGNASALCMPKSCGKSTLVKSLTTGNQNKIIVVDMDEMLINLLTPSQKRQVDELKSQNNRTYISICYPIVKEWYNKLKKEFPKHRLLIVSESVDLIEYLEIVDCTILIPCRKLKETIKVELDEEGKELLEKSYLEMISSANRDLFYFSNWDNMRERVIHSYGLRESI